MYMREVLGKVWGVGCPDMYIKCRFCRRARFKLLQRPQRAERYAVRRSIFCPFGSIQTCLIVSFLRLKSTVLGGLHRSFAPWLPFFGGRVTSLTIARPYGLTAENSGIRIICKTTLRKIRELDRHGTTRPENSGTGSARNNTPAKSRNPDNRPRKIPESNYRERRSHANT